MPLLALPPWPNYCNTRSWYLFSNCDYLDGTTLGDNLADYLDAGGVVVGFNFDWFASSTAIQGRWLTGSYTPFDIGTTFNFANGTLGTCTFSPLCNGVTTLNAFFRMTLTVAPGATQAATWNDGTPLMAYKGRAVGVSAYVGDASDNWSGQFARVIMNAGSFPLPCGTPTPTATATCGVYAISQIGGSIVPGTTDIGNHGDDTVTPVTLPFPFTLYDQTFTTINLSSNGNAQFTTTDTTFTNQCLPWLTHNYTIYPYWDDLYLVNSGFGIFTSISGTAPNRIFNIEWRAQYFPGSGTANFELRLYEGQSRFDVIYGRWTTATHRPQPGCRRTTPPLRSISATARVLRLLAGKATPRGYVQRRLRRRHLQDRLPARHP